MTCADELAYRHYEAALVGLARIAQSQPASTRTALLEEVRGHIEQAFWQARLRQQVTPASVAATPYCRALPIGPQQQAHVDALRRGMLMAERSFAVDGEVSPWNSLLHGRKQLKDGHERESFECGFLMRMFQLLHEACATRPAGARANNSL